MSKSNKSDTKKEELIAALEKSLGVVTTACKSIQIARSTFYEWYNKDDNFRSRVDELQNIALDFAETALHQQIKAGNTSAIIFFLKTKGKNRGFVERQEIFGNIGQSDIPITKWLDDNEAD